MTQPLDNSSFKSFQNNTRNELYAAWFKLTNDFNPSPSFDLVYDHFQFIMSQLENPNPNSHSLISTAMNIWCEHIPQDIPVQSHYAWRSLIIEFACDQIIKRPRNRLNTNTELLSATKKILGSLNLFDQAQLMIQLQNKAKFSGQLSQTLKNEMVPNEIKRDLEQAFHVIQKTKNGENYLLKAAQNKIKQKKEAKKKEKDSPLPNTRSPSPFQLEAQSSPSLSKKTKLD